MTAEPPKRSPRLVIAAILVGLVIVAAAVVVVLNRQPATSSSTGCGAGNCVTSIHKTDSISVSGLSICPTDCLYPSPYVSGTVIVNGATPLLTLTVYVNGTFDAEPINLTASQANTLTVFAYEYKGSVPNSFIPLVSGDTYVFTFIALFEDGSNTRATSGVTVTTSTSTSTGVGGTTVVLVQQGSTYQVQSSYDCVAGHAAVPFNVTTSSTLRGAIVATTPGITVYLATAQEVQTISAGHPASWIYSSGLTNSTSFSVLLQPGSYVLWTEGADLGCGATIVTPLEQMTTVTVTQAIELTPA